ncbi:hypothetical protein ACFFX0_15605 [Citricoccus parietis]|uniref:Uncharacterized protein n=1 Tax=Citricoccus parietis TaxID=592307 RepID=A0ABV5G1L9_9MICC
MVQAVQHIEVALTRDGIDPLDAVRLEGVDDDVSGRLRGSRGLFSAHAVLLGLWAVPDMPTPRPEMVLGRRAGQTLYKVPQLQGPTPRCGRMCRPHRARGLP